MRENHSRVAYKQAEKITLVAQTHTLEMLACERYAYNKPRCAETTELRLWLSISF
jgi:hypothetical protein